MPETGNVIFAEQALPSLADAAFCLLVAIFSNNVVITMVLGFAAMFGLRYRGAGI